MRELITILEIEKKSINQANATIQHIMKIIGTNTTKLVGIEPREGELLITKIQRAKKQGELIKDVAEIMVVCFRVV